MPHLEQDVFGVEYMCKYMYVFTFLYLFLKADDDKVISGSYDHTLKIWDIRSGHCNATLR